VNPILKELVNNVLLSGHVPDDAAAFLRAHGCEQVSKHCRNVAEESVKLAQQFNLDTECALQAGWLHDVSAVIPNSKRLWYARRLGIQVLQTEISLPMILHQKLSKVFASEIFGVHCSAVLEAVECHTTLKRNPSPLDMAIFVADKLAWDQEGVPPYEAAMKVALQEDLLAAVKVYLNYMWERRDRLPVLHPWLVEAVQSLLLKT
jgi:predicted HD superfamily hydrolase involved in NAD metabolism